MEGKQIVFFADSTQETGKLFKEIVRCRSSSGPLLSSFLDQTCDALQDERRRLSSGQKALLPLFRDLHCISSNASEANTRHPAVALTELVLVQLAHFIKSYEGHPAESYPHPSDSVCVGLCFGQLAAAAVALSHSLHNLIPLAVHAVRLAFRGGVLAHAIAENIEPALDGVGTWGLSVPKDSGLESPEKLASLQNELKIVNHKRSWLSAVGNTSITLSGPPSTLDKITKFLLSKLDTGNASAFRRLLINAPYHAEHIYSEALMADLVSDLACSYSPESFRTITVEKQLTLVGGFGGSPRTSSVKQFFQETMREIYTDKIDWSHILSACGKALGSTPTSFRVRAFGPDLQGRYLASAIEKQLGHRGKFDSDFTKFNDEALTSTREPLAIVGMAGRFPMSNSPDEMWKLLCDGVDTVREVPADRFDKNTHFDVPLYGCFLEQPGHFDPKFFQMSPREAIHTDPGQRMGLTTVQEAMEMAGFVPDSTPSNNSAEIGCFWGNATDDYREEYMAHNIDPYYIPGSIRAFGPGRVNYFYKFDGPTAAFDTACSSSLVAMNYGCASIWNGDCTTAIVVGSNILCAPYLYKGLDLGHFLSRTGGCKTFDEQADGYCRGEAVATVLVKKLSDAEADNDNILGVIRSISTNHSSNATSITRPHGPTQEKLFSKVLRDANLQPDDVSYVEMHGTGTQAGDMAELTSVMNVLAPQPRSESSPLWVGAVKSNLGHGEGASGLTSLIKTLLMLREQKIPPHIGIKSGVRRSKPDIDAKNVQIATELTDWNTGSNALRRVLISNFSAAAGNTAMVVEEYKPRTVIKPSDIRPSHMIATSGKSVAALQQNMERLLSWAQSNPEIDLADLSYSLTSRRTHYNFRCGFPVSSTADLQKQLERRLDDLPDVVKKDVGPVAVFTGFSNLWPPGMKELFKTSSTFRSHILRLDQSVQRQGLESILPALQSDEQVTELTFVQRQLAYALSQFAMFKLVQSWGVKFAATTGHSFGEYVALCASEMISSEDLIYLVNLRAQALQQKCDLSSHGMLAVQTSLEQAKQFLGADLDSLELSCLNSPTSIVLSGLTEKLDRAKTTLATHKVASQRVDTPMAFHSSQMDVVIEDLVVAEAAIQMRRPSIPLLSPTEGRVIKSEQELEAKYLQRHTRNTVDFATILTSDYTESLGTTDLIWLEIGPHSICTPMVKSSVGSKAQAVCIMRRDESIWSTIPVVVSMLYNAGHLIDWYEYHRDFEGRQQLIDVPYYALDEQHYWLSKKTVEADVKPTTYASEPASQFMDLSLDYKTVHRLVSRSEYDGFLVHTFETDLMRPHLYEMMKGHIMNDSYLCPASVLTDIAHTIAAYLRSHAEELSVPQNFRASIANMDVQKPVIAPPNIAGSELFLRIVTISDIHDKHSKLRFETTDAAGKRHIHAQCRILFEKKQDMLEEWSKSRNTVQREIGDLEAQLFRGLSQKLLTDLVYRLFDSAVVYGEHFRCLNEVVVDQTGLKATASIQLYRGPGSEGFECCPYWMDGLVHLAGFLVNGLRGSQKSIYIASGWSGFRLADSIDPTASYRVFVDLEDRGSIVNAQCYILIGDRIVGTCDNLKFQRLPKSIVDKILPPARRGEEQQQLAQKPTYKQPFHTDGRYESQSFIDSGTVSPKSMELETPAFDDEPEIDLVAILGEETGSSLHEIAHDQELTDLGIDSLLSLTITDRLRDEFKLDALPADLFQQYMTFGALDSYLTTMSRSRQSSQSTAVLETRPTSRKHSIKPSVKTQKPETRAEPQLEAKKVSSSVSSSAGIAPPEKVAKLREIISSQMGMEVSKISPTDDLAGMGMDSLMTLEIVEAFQLHLGMQVDPNVILANPSLRALEMTLFGNPSDAKSSSVRNQNDSERSCPPRSPKQKLMVCLQGDPNRCSTLMYMFPDGSGSAGVYSQLPLVDRSVCIYGLNSPFLRQGIVDGVTIATMVDKWVEEIIRRQPSGPYHLGGYSSGGYYAYEAARLLMARNQAVETLVLIDSPSRNVYEALPGHSVDAIVEAGVIGGHTPKWIEDSFRTSIQAVESYQPKPLPEEGQPRIYLIFADSGIEQVKELLQKRDSFDSGISKFFAGVRGPLRSHGWAELVKTSNIRLAQNPGHHFSVVLTPNSANLSRLIGDAITNREESFQRLGVTVLAGHKTSTRRKEYADRSPEQFWKDLNEQVAAAADDLPYHPKYLAHAYCRYIIGTFIDLQGSQMTSQTRKHLEWMQNLVKQASDLSPSDENPASLESDLVNSGPEGRYLVMLGKGILSSA